MRGADVSQPALFITRTVADFVPPDYPLRALRELIDEALKQHHLLEVAAGQAAADTG